MTSGQAKYLLAVYELQPSGKVRLVDVAQKLGVSKPSVHRMFRRLQDNGMIILDSKKGAALTEEGKTAVGKYAEEYYMILHFFRSLLKMEHNAAQEVTTVILEGGKEIAVDELCRCIRFRENNKIPVLQTASK